MLLAGPGPGPAGGQLPQPAGRSARSRPARSTGPPPPRRGRGPTAGRRSARSCRPPRWSRPEELERLRSSSMPRVRNGRGCPTNPGRDVGGPGGRPASRWPGSRPTPATRPSATATSATRPWSAEVVEHGHPGQNRPAPAQLAGGDRAGGVGDPVAPGAGVQRGRDAGDLAGEDDVGGDHAGAAVDADRGAGVGRRGGRGAGAGWPAGPGRGRRRARPWGRCGRRGCGRRPGRPVPRGPGTWRGRGRPGAPRRRPGGRRRRRRAGIARRGGR